MLNRNPMLNKEILPAFWQMLVAMILDDFRCVLNTSDIVPKWNIKMEENGKTND